MTMAIEMVHANALLSLQSDPGYRFTFFSTANKGGLSKYQY